MMDQIAPIDALTILPSGTLVSANSESMADTKERVLKVYPDAVLIKDTSIGGITKIHLPYLLIHSMPGIPDNEIIDRLWEGNFKSIFPQCRVKPISLWCETEKECWQVAWERIQEKMYNQLNT